MMSNLHNIPYETPEEEKVKSELLEIENHELNKFLEEQMTYQEINPTEWTYEEDGDFIEGILIKVQENVGTNKSMLYSIETSEGVKNVWGSAILDSRMALVRINSQIKITYKGLGESKSGKHAPKIFKVEIDK